MGYQTSAFWLSYYHLLTLKKFFIKYWPLLAGVAALAVYYFAGGGKAALAALFGAKPAAPVASAVVAPVRVGTISIDPDEITMQVIPRTAAPGTDLAVSGGGPDVVPYIADTPSIAILSPSLNV